jgi:two-component system chemotaxis response regulator CheB
MEMSRLKDQLVDIVTSVAEATPGTEAPTTPSVPTTGESESTTTRPTDQYVDRPTLLVGSSTGGPTVVEDVMAALPADAGFRVLIVQHMPEGFTSRFAKRLDDRSEYDVREATDGARIGAGEALVAAGSNHMEVANYTRGTLRVALTDDPPVNSVVPSVDVTMETAAETIDDPVVGVILTGMGTDGAEGITQIKAAGGATIAQDEASSAVFGMPQRAIETGCVDSVEPIDTISEAILSMISQEDD